MAAQGYSQGQSVNRPPLFDGEDYTYWKTRMEYFLQGLDYQIWSLVEEGDLLVTNEKDKWTEDDKKKISLNYKAKSVLCCALSKKEFNIISACKSAMEMWEKFRITYEGTNKVKKTRIDILVTQYERFQMHPGESITQMFSRFTGITNGLASLGKTYEMGDMVRKILRSLPSSWTPKVTTIEEANDLKRMSLEKLVGSLMAHEINMERLGESLRRKKHSNALKSEEDLSEEFSNNNESIEDDEDEEAMLSRRLQRILEKKKKYQSSRRYFKKNKDFKKPQVKDPKKAEPICYECKKPRHIKAECPKLKKSEFKRKDSSKKFRRYKKVVMAAVWSNRSNDSESISSEDEEEKANLAFMANIDEKVFQHYGISVVGDVSEKMGQAICSKNLRKSGFSVVNGVWSKTFMAEEIVPPSSRVSSVLRDVLDSIQSYLGELKISDDQATTTVASGHTDEIIMEEALSQGEQEDAHKNVQVDDAPIQGEQGVEKEAAPQGEHIESVPMNIEKNVESVEPSERVSSKRKRVAHRKPREK
ncbi:hypothetical protein Taro_040182 [Colocasia esculenta]|uniref:CCHC-type domain-containing protein n=1 Tax=Colocasia esculenta TaxID=4460 RepID=A0A843W8A7_COLES|nr:hypothetical protein [Colocasia esculenta]